jgi:YegS/Rv2252/BmrU family lipid kinase
MQIQSLWLIYNPAAANGRAAKLAPQVARVLGDQGIAVTSVATTGPGSATAQVRQALAAGHQTIAVLGGDGTLHDVVNGFFTDGRPTHPAARLAVLHAGTGGDFARTLGLPRQALAGAAALASARPVPVDIGVLHCLGLDGQPKAEVFINVANVGMAGDVVERVNRTSKALGGFVSFLIGSVASILAATAKPMTLTWEDGSVQDGRFHMVTIGNGRFFGGGMAVCPGADVADGRFDLVTLGDLSRGRLLAEMPRVYAGSHLGRPGISHRLGQTLKVDGGAPVWVEADGELIGTTPLQVTILPAALTLLL